MPPPVVKRRALLAASAALPAVPMSAQGISAEADIRRIVTSQNAEGQTQVLMDGAPPVAFELNGTTITRLWETRTLPVSLPNSEDATLDAGNAYREGFVGTSLYFADLPGGGAAPAIPLHRNASLDYIAVMFGQVHLIHPEETIVMNAGDVLVQGGTEHTWENRSEDPARLLVVVVTGQDKQPR